MFTEETKIPFLAINILATLILVLLFAASLVLAGFTLAAIGETHWPPALSEAPMTWLSNTLSLAMPLVAILSLIQIWRAYKTGNFNRNMKWLLFVTFFIAAWMPGVYYFMTS